MPLTKKEEKNHNKQKVCHKCRKEFNTDDSDKKYHKVKDHCHYTEKYSTFSVQITKEITKKDKNGNDKIIKIS